MRRALIFYSLLFWVLFSLLLGAIILTIQLTVQQDMRQGANDPQIQIAEDTAAQLQKGVNPVSLVPNESIDIKQSLSPFIMIFDEQHDLIVGNALLDGQAPSLPVGVFDTREWSAPIIGHHLTWMTPQNENRFTWQPEVDVRQAVVLVHVDGTPGGYVAVGRSLREVEKRESNLYLQTMLAWAALSFAALVCTLILIFFLLRFFRSRVI